jgi:hypothetical protein
MESGADKGDAMTPKEKALGLIEKLPDDAGLKQICRRLYELREIELSLEEADRDEGIEQDELFRQLIAEYDAEAPDPVDAASAIAPSADSGIHRAGQSQNSD